MHSTSSLCIKRMTSAQQQRRNFCPRGARAHNTNTLCLQAKRRVQTKLRVLRFTLPYLRAMQQHIVVRRRCCCRRCVLLACCVWYGVYTSTQSLSLSICFLTCVCVSCWHAECKIPLRWWFNITLVLLLSVGWCAAVRFHSNKSNHAYFSVVNKTAFNHTRSYTCLSRVCVI